MAALQKQIDEVKEQIAEYKRKYEEELILTKKLKSQLRKLEKKGEDSTSPRKHKKKSKREATTDTSEEVAAKKEGGSTRKKKPHKVEGEEQPKGAEKEKGHKKDKSTEEGKAKKLHKKEKKDKDGKKTDKEGKKDKDKEHKKEKKDKDGKKTDKEHKKKKTSETDSLRDKKSISGLVATPSKKPESDLPKSKSGPLGNRSSRTIESEEAVPVPPRPDKKATTATKNNAEEVVPVPPRPDKKATKQEEPVPVPPRPTTSDKKEKGEKAPTPSSPSTPLTTATPSSDNGGGVLFTVRAIEAHKSKQKTDLSFAKGATIQVLEENTKAGTYRGSIGKKTGWFPAYYVVKV